MIRQIAPQFFTTFIAATLAYYRHKLGFDCLSTWQEPLGLRALSSPAPAHVATTEVRRTRSVVVTIVFGLSRTIREAEAGFRV
jgi:hypothetical protein